MGKSLQIRPDFTEELVGIMIQTMLTIIRFPRAPFALVPFSRKEERALGVDAKVEALCPLYLQFKRSFAYPEHSTSKIIRDRKKLKVNVSPKVLYFKLRAKRPNHNDFQHNILFELDRRLQAESGGRAFYVAPLFLLRSKYVSAVHKSSIFYWLFKYTIHRIGFYGFPFIFHGHDIDEDELSIIDVTRNVINTNRVNFQDIPLLNTHVVIFPHKIVTTHQHSYSYLENGSEVCFHEPTYLGNRQTLGKFIYEFLALRDGRPTTKMYAIDEAEMLLMRLAGEMIDIEIDAEKPVIDRWLDFGMQLKEKYDIDQYLLVRYRKEKTGLYSIFI